MNDAIIDTPEKITQLRMAVLIRALHFEVTTGMKMGKASLLRVARDFGVAALNKRTALDQLMKLYEEAYGEPCTLRK